MAGERYLDRVFETTTTTGDGPYTLAGPILGHQSFAVLGTGKACYYSVWEVDEDGIADGGWEVGRGTWTTGGFLSRDEILDSSNAGNPVFWPVGTKVVALVHPARQIQAVNRPRTIRETPAGVLDGVNVTFTLAAVPAGGTEEVYLNGLLLEPGAGNDYVLSADILTMATPPAATDRLKVSYLGV